VGRIAGLILLGVGSLGGLVAAAQAPGPGSGSGSGGKATGVRDVRVQRSMAELRPVTTFRVGAIRAGWW